MSSIIEIGGVDGSGKSTIIKSITDLLEIEGRSIYLPSSPTELSPLYPSSLEARRNWYVEAPAEQIIRANIHGAAMRNELCAKDKSEYIILDRGYHTTLASAKARLLQRGYRQQEADDLVSKVSEEYCYTNIEDQHILCVVSEGTVRERLAQEYKGTFKEYLGHFLQELDRVRQEEDVVSINNEQPLEKTIREIMTIIRGSLQ
jgi:thymidylate kinase